MARFLFSLVATVLLIKLGGLLVTTKYLSLKRHHPQVFLISNEPHVAHLVSDLSDSLSPIPTRRSGHGVQPHPVPARHIAA